MMNERQSVINSSFIVHRSASLLTFNAARPCFAGVGTTPDEDLGRAALSCGRRLRAKRRGVYLILTVNLNVPVPCGATVATVSVSTVEPAALPPIVPLASTAELRT